MVVQTNMAKDDILRKGISGADSKWHSRYLNKGNKPTKTRRLAPARKTARNPAPSELSPTNSPAKRSCSGDTRNLEGGPRAADQET